jgi:hypothetical protein
MRRVTTAVTVALGVLGCAASAGAQVLGTFRWQFQPHCNVLTLTAEQRDQAYLLTGFDDQCGGGAPRAVASGIGAPNPDGTITVGLTILTASGVPVHVNAVLSPFSISGPWTDADGNGGTLAFNPGPVSGAPRPAPRVQITTAQIAPGAVTADKLAFSAFAGTGSAATVARSDHDHDTRYYTGLQVNALFLNKSAFGPRGLIAHGEIASSGFMRHSASSNGGAVTVERISPGRYEVRLPGFASGNSLANSSVFITPNAFSWHDCYAQGKQNGGGGDLIAVVICVDSTFAQTDSGFYILVVS